MLDARNVTAIVVTYNRLPLLKQCLAALRAQTVQGFTVLLVDNASTDGTADYIKTLAMPGLVCRNPGENLGGAGGFAYGIRAAAELGCEAVWIMDDDTLPEPDALAALLAADAAHEAGIWIGICGELGADPDLLPTFLAIGIDELSVAPSAVLPLRAALRKSIANCCTLDLLMS